MLLTQVLVVQLVTQKLLHCVHKGTCPAEADENTDSNSQEAVATTAMPHLARKRRRESGKLGGFIANSDQTYCTSTIS